MENKSPSIPVTIGRDITGELNMYIYDSMPVDVNELIRQNRELTEEIKTLSVRLEWAMNQLKIKDALLKRL